jgi:hypothetical protein
MQVMIFSFAFLDVDKSTSKDYISINSEGI